MNNLIVLKEKVISKLVLHFFLGSQRLAQRQSGAVGGEELLQKSLALKEGGKEKGRGKERALGTGGGWASRRSDGGGCGRTWPREYLIFNFKVFSVLRHRAALPLTYMRPCARVNVRQSRKKICSLHLS